MIKYVFLVLYLVIMIWVGIRSSRKIKTTGDFFVAGKTRQFVAGNRFYAGHYSGKFGDFGNR